MSSHKQPPAPSYLYKYIRQFALDTALHITVHKYVQVRNMSAGAKVLTIQKINSNTVFNRPRFVYHPIIYLNLYHSALQQDSTDPSLVHTFINVITNLL